MNVDRFMLIQNSNREDYELRYDAGVLLSQFLGGSSRRIGALRLEAQREMAIAIAPNIRISNYDWTEWRDDFPNKERNQFLGIKEGDYPTKSFQNMSFTRHQYLEFVGDFETTPQCPMRGFNWWLVSKEALLEKGQLNFPKRPGVGRGRRIRT